ncbi:NAD(P)-dependent oxidoreductase [Roseovarius indicus]|uniref:NAD(P)-dependent oxidoreductase n=1 Tax=Roseovarius indicus TaxID=540747 RepID=UPI0007D946BA|nr:NAD(P)-dependent oxidoreductase [Roseovarius indicus]OAO03398.1 3-hydroxyisobutyrate dehydrogenase [Roseovarius indicus]
MTQKTKLGYIGLGQMGAAMAERLLGDDAELHVFDTSSEAMNSFTVRGAIGHGSPREVADAAEVVFACLPNQGVSEAVAYGSDGVVHGSAVRVYAEMSTIGKTCMEGIADRLAKAGILAVDAPITGGPPAAREGRLAMLAAGAQEALDRVVPWLDRIGRQTYVLGQTPGQAQVMKVVNNAMMAANMVIASEGLVMGAKAGLDPDAMMEVLTAGTGQSAAATILAKAALTGGFDFGAHLSIVEKDAKLGLSEAAELDVPVETMQAATRLWDRAAQEGRGGDDFTSIIQLIEEAAGAQVRSK